MTRAPAAPDPAPPSAPDSICIGAVLWDIVGRSASSMRVGSDVPGRITRLPGGVALNIAMALQGFGLKTALLSVVGRDAEGEELMARLADLGLITEFTYRSADLPTDRYMAIEGANGLVAAIADAHSLEAAGSKILRALADGRLGSETAPFEGIVALDGNLTLALLAECATSPILAQADLRVAPASPGKAERLLPFLRRPRATLYVNKEEAGILCKSEFDTSREAARALVERGASRAIVTDGGQDAADARSGDDPKGEIVRAPPAVLVSRVTGAGDTFMAGHIAAEADGASRDEALARALRAAAKYVSGGSPF
ncbi:MAG: PfkB family carbohydrate kinase [Pseudomonadota bacterium]